MLPAILTAMIYRVFVRPVHERAVFILVDGQDFKHFREKPADGEEEWQLLRSSFSVKVCVVLMCVSMCLS